MKPLKTVGYLTWVCGVILAIVGCARDARIPLVREALGKGSATAIGTSTASGTGSAALRNDDGGQTLARTGPAREVETPPSASEFAVNRCETHSLGAVCKGAQYCSETWVEMKRKLEAVCASPPWDAMITEIDLYGSCGDYHLANVTEVDSGRVYFYDRRTLELVGVRIYKLYGGKGTDECFGAVPKELPACKPMRACATG